MASSVQYAVDDKDLDDAALWAVIDSAAAASHSSSRSRKPLAIKYTNHPLSPNPNCTSSPPFYKLSKNPRNHNHRALIEGEVICEPVNNHCRPQKIPRYCETEAKQNIPAASPPPHLAIVNHVQQQQPRTPTTPLYSSTSPQSYSVLSPPDNGMICVSDQMSSGHQCRKHEEKVEPMRHSLSGQFPSVARFKEYQNSAMAILEKGDFTMISGNPFIKKSGWRKISFFFNLSFEIKDKTIEFDENRNVQRAEFIVRASMQGGRFSDGWGSCERREKRFLKPNHDIPSTAETRAKNKACQDLLGIGEYRPGAFNVQQH